MKIVVPLVELWTALWLSPAEALVTWSAVREEVHEVLGAADNRAFPPSAAQQLRTVWAGGDLQQRAALVAKSCACMSCASRAAGNAKQRLLYQQAD